MVKRNTIQRALVLDTVRRLRRHLTADEVYEEILHTYPNISRATVYRDLQQLCEAGEITKCEIPGSPDHYDFRTSNHYHAKCTLCGKVQDVDMAYIPDLIQSVQNADGFKIESHNIIFSGICKECQNKQQ